jgi:hypothetical protein
MASGCVSLLHAERSDSLRFVINFGFEGFHARVHCGPEELQDGLPKVFVVEDAADRQREFRKRSLLIGAGCDRYDRAFPILRDRDFQLMAFHGSLLSVGAWCDASHASIATRIIVKRRPDVNRSFVWGASSLGSKVDVVGGGPI